MKFEIVCTATLRPVLLFKTFQSFNYYFFKGNIGDYDLIINIDMVGVKDEDNQRAELAGVISVINQFKFKNIILRWTEKPNFATAWFWAMTQLSEPLVFYLEEDWLLLQKVNLSKMLEEFHNDDTLAHLRLSNFDSSNHTCKNWNKFTSWNGRYFEVEGDDKFAIGWCGHPGFTRTNFIRQAISVMNYAANPEKQIKGKRYPCRMNNLLLDNRFGVFTTPNNNKQIIDIGRKWMIDNGFQKKGNKAFFTTWERTS